MFNKIINYLYNKIFFKPFKITFISGDYQREFIIDKIYNNQNIRIELGPEFIIDNKKTYGFELRKIQSSK